MYERLWIAVSYIKVRKVQLYMNEQKFMELIQELVAVGTTNGGFLSKEEVSDCFAEMNLNDEQFALVAAYLKQNRIMITDYDTILEEKEETAIDEEAKETQLDHEEEVYYNMYLEDIAAIPALMEGESDKLLAAVREGDEAAKNRLIEGYLFFVAKLAKNYAGQGVTVNDLVQEGNMALIMALETWQDGDFEDYLHHEVEQTFARVIFEQTGQKNIGEKLAGRANRVLELSSELAEELGREATVEELAEKLHLKVEEVKDIMKLSLDVISVAEAAGDPSAFEPHEHEHEHEHICDDPDCECHHH